MSVSQVVVWVCEAADELKHLVSGEAVVDVCMRRKEMV